MKAGSISERWRGGRGALDEDEFRGNSRGESFLSDRWSADPKPSLPSFSCERAEAGRISSSGAITLIKVGTDRAKEESLRRDVSKKKWKDFHKLAPLEGSLQDKKELV